MTPELRPLDIDNVAFVARNMREWDKKEIFATRWTDDPMEVAKDCMVFPQFAWTVHLERPICAIGALPVHPKVWSVWMFATDEFQRVGLFVTKHARRVMMPALTQAGAHRAHCLSVEGHDEAQKWLHLLGARPEARLRGYGRDGEDFVFYVWRN